MRPSMFVLYNFIQLAGLLILFPILTVFVACSSKYRDRIPARLSLGLGKKLATKNQSGRTIWLHALSVGEVTSAVPLVRALRKRYPTWKIVVSTTTRSGKKVADMLLAPFADTIIDGPLDLLPTVTRFINCIRPDLFILVETDFWPNILHCLRTKNIPAILVNGRISKKSMTRYQRLDFFFLPMFEAFAFLAMQTRQDMEKMEFLGIAAEKLPILGNLKFATRLHDTEAFSNLQANLLPKNRILFIAGSTHPGEEYILLDCYKRLRSNFPNLFLIVAPRDPARAKEIVDLAIGQGLSISLRSTAVFTSADIFILDSIGELNAFYALADLAFVGGSLVEKGGHNPVEPAAMAKPVFFGPHMEDFSEIADTLIAEGGAIRVNDKEELLQMLTELLENSERSRQMGIAAKKCVLRHQDIIANHLQLIEKVL